MSGVSLAKSLGAKVSVIIVEPSFEVYNVPESQVRQMSEAFAKHSEQIKKHAATVLDRAAETARAAGVTCNKIQMEHHSPYEAIITAANDGACDLIVMASHGRSGLKALMLGSETMSVLTSSKIPVLVLR